MARKKVMPLFENTVPAADYSELDNAQALVLHQSKTLTPAQQAEKEVDDEMDHQLKSFSAAFRALQKAAPKIVRSVAKKWESGKKVDFDRDLFHSVLYDPTRENIKKFLDSLDVVDRGISKNKWTRNAMKKAFYRLVGIQPPRGFKETVRALTRWLDPEKLERNLTEERIAALEWFFDEKTKQYLKFLNYHQNEVKESQQIGAEEETEFVNLQRQWAEIYERIQLGRSETAAAEVPEKKQQ